MIAYLGKRFYNWMDSFIKIKTQRNTNVTIDEDL
jgi:hypothetical protein